MPAVLEHPASLLDSAPETPAAFPAWFADRQRAAWQRVLDLPTPKRGHEMWRFSSFKQLDFAAFDSRPLLFMSGGYYAGSDQIPL